MVLVSFIWYCEYGLLRDYIFNFLPYFIKFLLVTALAETLCIPLKNPFEVTVKQQQTGQNETIWQTVERIYKTRGVAGFFMGMKWYLLREVPYYSLQFMIFELLVLNSNENLLLKGGLATALSIVFTYPIDQVKTKLQTSRAAVNPSPTQIAQQIWADYRIAGFY